MIESELRGIVHSDGIMPTVSKLRSLGRNDLANQIGRNGGFVHWAERIGAVREHSDSETGWSGEVALQEKLKGRGFEVERMQNVKAPYDLRVDGCVRIDVKAANYAEYGACRGWFYRVGKAAQADILALYQLDTGVVYFLPWLVCPETNVTISRDGGKWAEFRDRYDLLQKLIQFRKQETSIWSNQSETSHV